MKILSNKKVVGLGLLAMALILGVSRGVIIAFEKPENATVTVAFTLVFTLLTVFILHRIYQNKQWAKMFLLGYIGLGLLMNFPSMLLWKVEDVVLFHVYISESVLNVLGLVLVFLYRK